MAGGYEDEDRQAELEELRRAKEREARDRVAAMRRAQELEEADAGMGSHEGSLRPPRPKRAKPDAEDAMEPTEPAEQAPAQDPEGDAV